MIDLSDMIDSNIVPNGEFSSSDLSDWYIGNSMVQWMVDVEPPSPPPGVAVKHIRIYKEAEYRISTLVDVTPGSTYEYAARIIGGTSNDYAIKFGSFFSDSAYGVAQGSVNNGSTILVTGTIIPSTDKLRVSLFNNASSGTGYIGFDFIRIVKSSLKFISGTSSLSFTKGIRFPVFKPHDRIQITDRDAAGGLQREDIGVTVRKRKLVFTHMPQADYDAFVSWYDTIAVGVLNPFTYIDEDGMGMEVILLSSPSAFRETRFERFAGEIMLELVA